MLFKAAVASTALSLLLTSVTATTFISAWWPAYTSGATVNWKYTDLAYYFVQVTTKTGFQPGDGQTIKDLQKFVSDAHYHKKKAAMTIGGYTGSAYYSTLVKTPSSRAAFATKIVNYLNKYHFDGVDIDWLYPNQASLSNAYAPEDSANLLKLLQLLRQKLGQKKWISVSVSPQGLYGPDGKTTLTDYSKYAKVVDVFNVLTLDYTGSFTSTTGSISPLYDCGSGYGSIIGGVEKFTKNKFPASKLVFSIPSYGDAYNLTSSTLESKHVTRFSTTEGNQTNNAKYTTKIFQKYSTFLEQPHYVDLISKGYLSKDGTKGGKGFVRYFDGCTATPFLFNKETKEFIAYEDSDSVSIKAYTMHSLGLKGASVFSSEGFNDQVYASIKQALGVKL